MYNNMVPLSNAEKTQIFCPVCKAAELGDQFFSVFTRETAFL